jgi:hypothetical protein
MAIMQHTPNVAVTTITIWSHEIVTIVGVMDVSRETLRWAVEQRNDSALSLSHQPLPFLNIAYHRDKGTFKLYVGEV